MSLIVELYLLGGDTMWKIKKLFTLIELIVVIVILGILAAIVIPNISSFKEEAEVTAINSNARNLQTAVDMYILKNNGSTPTKETPTLGSPQTIEYYAMKPDYLRDIPKNKQAKFWLDHNNTVWASMVDAPTEVNYQNGTLSWKTVDGAKMYRIYKTEDAVVSSSVNLKGLKHIENVPSTSDEKILPALIKGTYLVSAVDRFDYETAPVKVGTNYGTYQKPDKDFTLSSGIVSSVGTSSGSNNGSQNQTTPSTPVVEEPAQPINQQPNAVISMNPIDNIKTNTVITWSYGDSSDPDGDSIVNAEWVGKQDTYATEGNYTVKLRVQDSKGLWSEWVEKTFIVNSINGLYFNGSNTYAWVGSPAVIKTSQYTLETWFKTSGSTGDQRLYRYRLYGNSIYINNGNIGGYYYNSAGTKYAVQSTKRYDDNKWHHVAITFNGSQLQLYVDGVLEQNLTTNSPVYYGEGGAAIGRAGDDTVYYYKGYMNDLRIWNTVRTQEQIQQSMKSNLIGNELGLVANWKLNEYSGTIANDSSANKLNATIYNGSWY